MKKVEASRFELGLTDFQAAILSIGPLVLMYIYRTISTSYVIYGNTIAGVLILTNKIRRVDVANVRFVDVKRKRLMDVHIF